jgi:hypothetical protein
MSGRSRRSGLSGRIVRPMDILSASGHETHSLDNGVGVSARVPGLVGIVVVLGGRALIRIVSVARIGGISARVAHRSRTHGVDGADVKQC